MNIATIDVGTFMFGAGVLGLAVGATLGWKARRFIEHLKK